METGLEKMLQKIEALPQWVRKEEKVNEFGDAYVFYYNETIDVTCKVFYEKGMDQELSLVSMLFVDREEYSEWRN